MCSTFGIVGFESNGARCGFAGAGRNKICCDLVQENDMSCKFKKSAVSTVAVVAASAVMVSPAFADDVIEGADQVQPQNTQEQVQPQGIQSVTTQ